MADMNYLSDGTNTYTIADAQARADITDIKGRIGELPIGEKSVNFTDVISVDNAINVNAKSVKVKLEPTQDLHGYDKPWAGGQGKNLLQMTIEDLQALNTAGVWNDDVYTTNGIDFTVITDNDNNVIGIKANGTANNNADFLLRVTFKDKGYWLSGCPSGGGRDTYSIGFSNLGYPGYIDTGTGYAVNGVFYNSTRNINIRVYNGMTVSDLLFKPMCNAQNEIVDTFEPYSNICNIKGYNSVDITQKDTETNPTVTNTYTVNLNNTYYGGELDVTNGILTNTMGYISSYNGEAINEPWLSSMDEYVSGTVPTNGAEVVYPLSTPQTIQLTPIQIEMLLNNNVLYCNEGDTSLVYYVNDVIGEIEQQILALTARVEALENG